MTAPPPIAARQMTEEDVQQLVLDAAMEYHTPEDLALLLNQPVVLINALLASAPVQKMVLEARRGTVATGEGFKLKAKALAPVVLERVFLTVMDPDTSPADKLKGAAHIVGWAGLAPQPGPTTAVQINVALREGVARGLRRVEEFT